MEIEIINNSRNILPQYETEGSVGLDLRANTDDIIFLKSMERVLIPTGLFVAIPNGIEAQIRPRSGMALNRGITCLNTPGTIDSDYIGEIKVLLINLSTELQSIEKGERIAQLVFTKYEKIKWNQVSEFRKQTKRGAGGFGHTGKI